MAPHPPQPPARKSRCPRRRLDDGQLAAAHRAASRTVAAASDHIALRQPRLCPRSHSSLRRIAAFCSGVHARLRPDPVKISSRRTGSPFDLCKSSVSDTCLTRFRLKRRQTIAHSPTHLKVRSKGRLRSSQLKLDLISVHFHPSARTSAAALSSFSATSFSSRPTSATQPALSSSKRSRRTAPPAAS